MTKLEIIEIDFCPDRTYFRQGDVEPDLTESGVLKIYSGNGTHRSSWGQPGTTSTVILNEDDLTSIHIGFHHKHGGGQFWRHYKEGVQVEWKKLNEADRLRILDAFPDRAASWAKQPGKLKRDYIKPHLFTRIERDEQGAIIGYKWLAHAEGGGPLISPLYHTRWENDELSATRPPTDDNTDGIYAAKTPDSPILTGYRQWGVLVRLLLSGIVIEYNYGYRAQHAQIMEILNENR